MKKILAIILVALTMIIVNLNDQVVCPVCYSTQCFFTGNTQVVDGHFMLEYQCAMSHRFYVRQR